MSAPYKVGGGVSVKVEMYVTQRRMLDDPVFGKDIWGRLRLRMIEDLAERSGLPFHIAIRRITSWREEVYTQLEHEFMFPYHEQPVAARIIAHVGATEYIPDGEAP